MSRHSSHLMPACRELRTSPASFENPHSLRNRIGRVVWNLAYWTVYRLTPPRLGMSWRRLILRLFGAKIGRTWIHPSVRIWAPWLLTTGDDVYIDRGCNLYNSYDLVIDDRVVISFESVLCSATHDFSQPDYPLCGNPIHLEADSWIAAQAFLCPGVTIGRGSIVGARSVVTRSVATWTVVAGNPAKAIKQRELKASREETV